MKIYFLSKLEEAGPKGVESWCIADVLNKRLIVVQINTCQTQWSSIVIVNTHSLDSVLSNKSCYPLDQIQPLLVSLTRGNNYGV